MQVSNRRHDIDALRVIGTLLVFLFHCIQPFNPNEQWHIQNAEKSVTLGYVVTFFNIWVMPLFMLLAGASSFYALKKRTNAQYLRERFTRIFVPLVFGILIVVSPQVYLERRMKGQFEGDFLSFYPHFFEGVYPEGNFSWHHLWFLAYLFVYSIVGLLVFRAFQTAPGKKTIGAFAGVCDRKPLMLAVLAIPLVIFHVTLFWRFPQTNALLNDWAWHAQLFTVFIYGFVLVSDERFANAIGRVWKMCISAAVLLSLTVFALKLITIPPDDASYWSIFAVKGFVYRSASWLWILAFLGAARTYLSPPSYKLSYLNAASYPFYILHQTVIVAVAFFLIPLDISLVAKFGALLVLAFAWTAMLYEVCKRLKPLGWMLGISAPFSKTTQA